MTKKTTDHDKPAKLDLEKSFQELEAITHELESGSLDLQDSLAKFERGLELAAALKSRLSDLENKIETIKVKFKDTVEDESEDDEDEE